MRADWQFVINFHGIGKPHTVIDVSESAYWVSVRQFEAIIKFALARPDSEHIRFTFDDGNASDLAIGARILAACGRDAGFFVLTGRLDAPHYLSRADVGTLVHMGMEVGLHGRDHIDWRRITPAQLQAETVAARADLAGVTGGPVTAVAVPFGAYNRSIITHLRRTGYSRIYTSDGGISYPDQRVLGRTSVRAEMTLNDLADQISRKAPFHRRLKRVASSFARRHLI